MRRLRFDSLKSRNYRLYFIGQSISIGGTWMEAVAQSFLVLQLTGSGTQLGVVTAVRFGPMFVLGPWGGLVADRLNKWRILVVTQCLAGLISLAYCVLVRSGDISMPIVFGLSFALGLVNVFDNPARQSFIPDLVPRAQMANAVTLNSVTANAARVVGAAFGGVVASAVGLSLCFGINAVSFLAVVIALLRMNQSLIARHPPHERGRGQVREGFLYVLRTPDLLLPLTMIFVVGALAWEFPVSLPLLARNTFHGDAGTYGLMASAMGVGGVVGGLVSSARTKQTMVGLVFAGLGWGTAITVAALVPWLLLEYFVMIAVGYGTISFNSLAKTTLQLRADPAMRGRVMALWALAWLGSTPIGGPIVGWIGQNLGARWGLLVGGVATLTVSLAVYPRMRRIDRERTAAARAVVPEGEARAVS